MRRQSSRRHQISRKFPCEAGEKTKLDWGKNIGTQFDDETKKDLAKKWKELQKINTL